MTSGKERFEAYLQSRCPNWQDALQRFEEYFSMLQTANRNVNLVSRNLPGDRFWVQHFLDSLLVLECLDLSCKTVLDFGSGGGLPGIPLKLVVPDCSLILLDSVRKKTRILEEIVHELGLSGVEVQNSRVEDYAFLTVRPSFDYILCRAVALETRYIPPLRRLLKPGGMAVFYKAQKLDDLERLNYELLWEKIDSDLGLRRFIGISHKNLIQR